MSITLTFISKYFTQVYQSTIPRQHPLIIINILEYMNLILEAVVAKDIYMSGEIYTDVDEEEEASNMMDNTWKDNMDPFSKKQQCITKRSGWHFLLININHQLIRRLLKDGWKAVHQHMCLP